MAHSRGTETRGRTPTVRERGHAGRAGRTWPHGVGFGLPLRRSGPMAHPTPRYLQARYATRGPVPQDVIEAVAFMPVPLDAGQVLVEVLAAPINPSDVLTLTGDYGSLP